MNIASSRFTYLLLCISTIMFVSSHVCAITVYNESNRPIYVAFYYVKETWFGGANDNKRVTSIVEIHGGQHVDIAHPSMTLKDKRELMFTYVPTELKDTLNWDEYQHIGRKGIPVFNDCYIADKDGRLKAYTFAEWNVIKPGKQVARDITSVFTAPIIAKIKNNQPAIQQNPYGQTNVSVRVSKELDPQEIAYRAQRKSKIKTALEKLLGKSLDDHYIPEIAIVVSGGGYRAALYGMAALGVAQEKGLFDGIMEITALSGATWGLTYLVFESMRNPRPLSMIATDLKQAVTKPFGLVSPSDLNLLANALLVKAVFDQPLSSVDLFGLFIGDQLFNQYGDKKHRIYLSEQKKLLENGNWPLPIYTTVPVEAPGLEKLTYEFTPFEVWAPWGMSVPPYAFGDKFVNGVRVKTGDMFAPEQPMDILLGAFGSAHTATVRRAYEEVESDLPAILKSVIHNSPKEFSETRLATADFFNFTIGMADSPIKNNRRMLMGDAGLGVTGGLAFQPVSGDFNRRKADIYIILDISEKVDNGVDLNKVENYMRSQGRKFPKIKNYQGLEKTTITVFKDEADPEVPVVIYMPRNREQKNWDQYKDQPGFTHYPRSLATFDIEKCVQSRSCWSPAMQYSQELAAQISALGAFNMQTSMETIVDAINWVVDHKK